MTNITKLEQEILRHKNLYYKGHPEISDEEFDRLEVKLRSVNPNSWVLSYVGHENIDQEVPHKTPMLSLEKFKDLDSLLNWMDGKPCLVSDKMDGSSCSLVFETGIFNIAKTRGDGKHGQNITKHLQFVEFPKRLHGDCEIRGEVVISKENFDKLSKDMISRNLDPPKSIRNIVAGLLHKKSDIDLCKYLTFIAYDFLCETLSFSTESMKFSFLASKGFNIPFYSKVTNKSEVEEAFKGYKDNEKPFLTDGLVFALDNALAQKERGFTDHHPRGKVAFKFASETAITTVQDILVDVGRTGKLSFVAVVDSVELSGATISRVTLHNKKYIQDHKIGLNAQIEITRSGEVIPKHVRTVESVEPYNFPEQCPVCREGLSTTETGVDLVCTNATCPAKVYGRLENWISVVGIDNIGEETLSGLFANDLISNIHDLYNLTIEDLMMLDRMGKRNATKILKNIDSKREVDMEVALAGLGIDGLGKGVGKKLAAEFKSLDYLYEELIKSDAKANLMRMAGIGETLADNVLEGMEERGWMILQQLNQAGLVVKDFVDDSQKSLLGKKFVITGALSKPRKAIENWIATRGGSCSSAVSGKTDYLVCNQISNSGKSKKARDLGVPVISEVQLEEMGEV